jgi:putative acetyltransferase
MIDYRIRTFDVNNVAFDISAWKSLNLEWLCGYHHSAGPIDRLLEQEDFVTLDYPLESIINLGGKIWFAELVETKELIGSIAILPHNGYMEFLKLAVRPAYQGNGVGRALVKIAINYSKNLNFSKIILDSNSQLKAAVKLYQSFGFTFIPARGKFATADIAMELML